MANVHPIYQIKELMVSGPSKAIVLPTSPSAFLLSSFLSLPLPFSFSLARAPGDERTPTDFGPPGETRAGEGPGPRERELGPVPAELQEAQPQPAAGAVQGHGQEQEDVHAVPQRARAEPGRPPARGRRVPHRPRRQEARRAGGAPGEAEGPEGGEEAREGEGLRRPGRARHRDRHLGPAAAAAAQEEEAEGAGGGRGLTGRFRVPVVPSHLIEIGKLGGLAPGAQLLGIVLSSSPPLYNPHASLVYEDLSIPNVGDGIVTLSSFCICYIL